ncbi:MAG: chemotaxis protein CheW [Pseudomonadota bacterium]
MDDLLGEFLVETEEQLDELDASLVRLEQCPNDAEMLRIILRVTHTIKGSCGFFELPRLAKLAHATEALLCRYQDGAPMSAPGVTVILASLQRIKEILAVLAQGGVEPGGNDDDLIQAIDGLVGSAPSPGAYDALVRQKESERGDPEAEPAPSPVHEHFDALERAWREEGAPSAAEFLSFRDQSSHAAKAIENSGHTVVEPQTATDHQASEIRTQTVRVSVDTLETLMTTVSELVLARNQLLQIASRSNVPAFAAPLQQLSSVTVELQDAIMKARMQPITNAWRKLPMLVRTLSAELGKPIEIEMFGGDQELDRQVLEAIKDPLMHMVRNAADHSLETQQERIAAGKPEAGQICLRASQQGGSIVVEVSDDGRGLDVDVIRRSALARRLATSPELYGLNDAEICDLIFEPGFTTVATVSEISGRGMGMDVVRCNIEAIGGTVKLASTSASGTTFVINIPLTLTITPALIVEVSNIQFAIPQVSVVELVRVGKSTGRAVETINEAAVLRLYDRLIPLLDFATQLDMRGEDWPSINSVGGTVVIVQVGAKRFGLLVDAASQAEDIVVKPVSRLIQPVGLFSGSTILGDGSVVMIVDPSALSEAVGPMEVRQGGERTTDGVKQDENRTPLLLFRSGSRGLKAVPLSLITRLEAVPTEALEFCDGRDVIQYRGGLLPIVHMNTKDANDCTDVLPVLVFADGARAAGLVVDEIVDTVEVPLSIELMPQGRGVAGSTIVRDQAVEVVDAAYYLASTFQQQESGLRSVEAKFPHALLVTDSQFLRDMLAPLLRSIGLEFTVLDPTRETLNFKDAGSRFDIVVSDVEMPSTNALDLARAIRADFTWDTVPMIGLSSQPGPGLAEVARLAGFDALVGKFDRRTLKQALANWRALREEAA